MFAIGHHLETHPELVSQIATVFQWKLTDPESAWVLDVKNGKGSCKQGTAEKPDVTLELSDADFVAMATGKADAQKLYFGGKLKIGGNVMASQKLAFLTKIDRGAAEAAYEKKRGGAQASLSRRRGSSTPRPQRAAAATTDADHVRDRSSPPRDSPRARGEGGDGLPGGRSPERPTARGSSTSRTARGRARRGRPRSRT